MTTLGRKQTLSERPLSTQSRRLTLPISGPTRAGEARLWRVRVHGRVSPHRLHWDIVLADGPSRERPSLSLLFAPLPSFQDDKLFRTANRRRNRSCNRAFAPSVAERLLRVGLPRLRYSRTERRARRRLPFDRANCDQRRTRGGGRHLLARLRANVKVRGCARVYSRSPA